MNNPIKRPLLKAFGSKWQLAPYYPAPRYGIIAEPFARSGSYALRHVAPGGTIILNDIDSTVMLVWDWLLHPSTPREILRLPVATLQEGEDLRFVDGVSPIAAYWIAMWQRVGRNDCLTVSSWNNKPGMWQESVKRETINTLEWLELARVNVKLSCKEYYELDDIEATWFIDPPYQHQPRSVYPCGGVDYDMLSEWCQLLRGQVIVCEQQGADWLPFEPFRTLNAGCAHHPKKTMTEVIWRNDQ
jgi:hypothetical protein